MIGRRLFLAGLAPALATCSIPATVFPVALAEIPITVVDFGYHTVIVMEADMARSRLGRLAGADPRAAALRRAVANHAGAGWLEIGWGDRAVFADTRTAAELNIGEALRAVFLPTPSLLQIAPRSYPPEVLFASLDHVTMQMSVEQADALLLSIGASLSDPVEAVQPGFSPGAVFYASPLQYSALRTCNTWVAERLRVAGVPMPLGLMTSGAVLDAMRLAPVK